jgi:hypothetical protein
MSGILGAAKIRKVQRALQEHRDDLLSAMPLAQMELMFLLAAKRAIPKSKGQGPHTADRLTVVRRVTQRNRIELEIKGPLVAKFLITGTRPHPITPHLPPMALHFEWDGRWVFRRKVFHPGTSPNDWRHEAVALTRPALATMGYEGAHFWLRMLQRSMG